MRSMAQGTSRRDASAATLKSFDAVYCSSMHVTALRCTSLLLDAVHCKPSPLQVIAINAADPKAALVNDVADVEKHFPVRTCRLRVWLWVRLWVWLGFGSNPSWIVSERVGSYRNASDCTDQSSVPRIGSNAELRVHVSITFML